MASPAISFETDGCVMGSWKNITIVVWGTQATVALVSELARFSDELVKLHPKLSTVHMIINGAPMPDTETRMALESLSERYTDQIACAGTLIEGGGFWASAMRSFLTGLNLIARPRFKTKTCATTRELAGWLVPVHARETGVQIDEAELTRILDGMLSRPSARNAQRAS
jgi:hypothetical protein